jgi:hypothetical protein
MGVAHNFWSLCGVSDLYAGVLSSKLGDDTGYPVVLRDFPVPTGKYRYSISSRPLPLPSISFPIHHSSIILASDTVNVVK